MAKPLIFQFDATEISFAISKVDRSKLYGYKDLEVLDEQERPCVLATLSDDGRTVIGKGGIALGQLTADGHWTKKSELMPVDLEGKEMVPVASSFAAPVNLRETATLDEYLSHNIRSVYVMTCDDDSSALLQKLKDGTIFKFPYSFRGGLEPDTGLLLMGQDENIFMTVGQPTKLQFIGLPEKAAVVVEEEDDDADDGDLMDFAMI